MKGIEIKEQFYLDGEPFRLRSGAIHYFRIVPEYWQDRLEKLKAMGCNTVETYIPWNLHEPQKGTFCFDGGVDLGRFITLAKDLGLYVILRPSPYICAEWEFGGFPAWLLKEDGMKLRCSYAPYLQAVEEYYRVLIPYIAEYQYDRGGPVIMMQVENEYGYYGNDHQYLEWMTKLMRSLGVTVPLFTSDGPFSEAFRCGKAGDLLQTGNFGSRAEERFAFMKQYVDGPLSCMEFWLGWFDHWGGGGHHVTSIEQNTKDLSYMLDHGNVNIYMFIGGTNFGFMNGANFYGELTPDVTSYDYDAVLTEDGQITEKYKAFQAEIGKRYPLPQVTLSTPITRASYGSLKPDGYVTLWDTLEKIAAPKQSVYPISMERLDQSYGYILYRTGLPEFEQLQSIFLKDAADRAKIYADGKEVLTLYDNELRTLGKIDPPVVLSEKRLDLLVENMGRVNFGPMMEDQRKGIDGSVVVNTHQVYHFEIYNLPLEKEQLSKIAFGAVPEELPAGVSGKDMAAATGDTMTAAAPGASPAFYHFTLEVDTPADTFLDVKGWGKGCAFINGFNLGRFWEIGPQETLYLPGPLLKQGKNELILFETEGKMPGSVKLVDEPRLGAVLVQET